jgi:phage/plasmid-like protein (TIGR03299 family)
MAYRFADRRDLPWHGLGAQIARDEQISASEFQKRADAIWTISKRPVWWRPSPDVSAREDKDHFVLQRDDNFTVLNIVSRQYKPVQNSEIFHFFHEFCERGEMTLETGGVLDEGRKVWALAALRKGFTLANDDPVSGYCLLSDSRDGGALRGKFTGFRVVCANTLALALGDSGTAPEFRLIHRSSFVAAEAKRVLGLSGDFMEKLREQSEFLVSRPMSGTAFTEFLERLFPPKEYELPDNKGTEVRHPRAFDYAKDALTSQVGAEKNQGTWWQGVNAVTYMLDHNRNRISDDANRLQNSWFGAGDVLRRKALSTALEMAR